MTTPRRTSVIAAVLVAVAAAASPDPRSGPVEEQTTPLWQVLERLAQEREVQGELEGVVEHLRSMVNTRVAKGRLSRVLGILANPWTAPERSRELRNLLLASFGYKNSIDLEQTIAGVGEWLDYEDFGADDPEPEEWQQEIEELWAEVANPEVVELDLLEALSALLGGCHDAIAESLTTVDDATRALVFEGHGPASEAWYRSHFPGGNVTDAQNQALEDYKKALVKVSPRRPLEVAMVLQRLASADFLKGLPKRLMRTPKDRRKIDGLEGDVMAVVGESPESRIILGGRGKTRYDVEAALVIDLGGNDRYARAAVVDSPGMLASVVIDLAGNDLYETDQPGPAYSVGGFSMLVDKKGEDVYQSGRHGQAVSAGGVALLIDLAGRDRYTAEDYSQGYSLCGVALLFDVEGDDEYTAWAYSQGAGIGFGFNALVDGEGDDRYLADLHWPDVYGDSGPNIYHGASQGYNLGLRDGATRIAGGISVLADRGDGKDRYQSGNFSQGGGYFFGFGLMYDGGGDDENLGTRYSQGFGVHQAVGVRWDEAGDDTYKTRSVAHCGSAWDEGVGWLIDSAGNDVYECGGLALGGAAQTAVAVLFDADGVDRYQSSNGAGNQGGAGGSDYHNKQSVGFLLDLGGDKDTYSRSERNNNEVLTSDWVGVFYDSPFKDLEKVLASKKPLSK